MSGCSRGRYVRADLNDGLFVGSDDVIGGMFTIAWVGAKRRKIVCKLCILSVCSIRPGPRNECCVP